MKRDSFVITIQVEDSRRGTLDVVHTVDLDELNTYNGPLGRIILHNAGMPDSQFVMPAHEFIIMLAQFIQNYRGIV